MLVGLSLVVQPTQGLRGGQLASDSGSERAGIDNLGSPVQLSQIDPGQVHAESKLCDQKCLPAPERPGSLLWSCQERGSHGFYFRGSKDRYLVPVCTLKRGIAHTKPILQLSWVEEVFPQIPCFYEKILQDFFCEILGVNGLESFCF